MQVWTAVDNYNSYFVLRRQLMNRFTLTNEVSYSKRFWTYKFYLDHKFGLTNLSKYGDCATF
jgi:hypothetical protein